MQRDRRAGLREPDGRSRPNPTAGAGDKHNLIREVEKSHGAYPARLPGPLPPDRLSVEGPPKVLGPPALD
ncbi:hypothetical protein GCM10027269_15360 [Kribbella endophytica]